MAAPERVADQVSDPQTKLAISLWFIAAYLEVLRADYRLAMILHMKRLCARLQGMRCSWYSAARRK
jgi:hypothetical protein